MLTWEIGAIALAGLAATAEDLVRRTISNWIPVFALAAGLAIHAARSGWGGLAASLGGAACGFAVFLVFYLLGGMGGGDIKLMSGMGAILGASRVWTAAWWTAILGAVLALAVLLLRRTGRKASIPYAPPIALGAYIAMAS
ncbi:MAG: A24 family peptidase [Bryobacteraceae bacterium]|nr:A24 family peptidase [Bryobacteraceae bacterium]